MDKPVVTVITIVRDGARTLTRAISSLQAQTYNAYEHVLVVAPSSDSTLKIAQRYRGEDPRVILLERPARGVYPAFNDGLNVSRGQFVSFLNADDWYSPQFLESSVKTLVATGADWTFADCCVYSGDGSPRLWLGDPHYGDHMLSTFTRFQHTTVVMRSELIKNLGGFRTHLGWGPFKYPLKVCSDMDMFARAARRRAIGAKVEGIVGHQQLGGISTQSDNLRRALIEGTVICLANRGGFRSVRSWVARLLKSET